MPRRPPPQGHLADSILDFAKPVLGMTMSELSELSSLVASLRAHPHVQAKLRIGEAYAPALTCAGETLLGDDAAAIRDGDGWLLFAAEGMLESFVQADPWFAGYSAVMVNLSDIAAMGGRPLALTNVLWTSDESPATPEIWAGLRAACAAYGVPMVGGHTTRFPAERTPLLAVSVLGRARKLITSFDAQPGDVLLMAVDLRATFRGDGSFFWNASVGAPAERLRGDLEILPLLAERGLVTAGKDISNGGIPGTLAMLLATSGVGAELWLDALPRPDRVEILRWLLSFPSFGYLLAARSENVATVRALFAERGIACVAVGEITRSPELVFTRADERCVFCAVADSPARRASGHPARRPE